MRPAYSDRTGSVLWLFIPWLLAVPRHQQMWHSVFMIYISAVLHKHVEGFWLPLSSSSKRDKRTRLKIIEKVAKDWKRTGVNCYMCVKFYLHRGAGSHTLSCLFLLNIIALGHSETHEMSYWGPSNFRCFIWMIGPLLLSQQFLVHWYTACLSCASHGIFLNYRPYLVTLAPHLTL